MTTRRRWWAVAAIAGLLALLLVPALSLADTTIQGDIFRERKNAEVPAGVVVQGDVRVVRADAGIAGKVEGNVTVERGSLTVSGQVAGDVRVIRGTVKVTSTGKIDGTLFLERSSLDRETGAQISTVKTEDSGGDVVVGPEGVRAGGLQIGPEGIQGPGISIGPDGVHLPGLDIDPSGVRTPGMVIGPAGIDVGTWGGLGLLFGIFNPVFKFFKWAAVFALALAVVAIWPGPVKNLSLLIGEDPGRTFLAGLLATGVLILAALALLITIIGIPLAMVLLFAAWIAYFFGYVSLSVYLGHKLGETVPALKGSDASPFLPLLVGSLALTIAGLVPVIGWLVGMASWLFAIGVVYQSRFGLSWPSFKKHPPTVT